MPNTNDNDEQVFSEFVGGIVRDMGLEEENKRMHGGLAQDIRGKLDEAIGEAMIRALPDEKADELSKMLDGDATDEEIEKFFDNSGVDYNAVLTQTLEDFREAFVGMTKDAGEAQASTAETAEDAKEAQTSTAETAEDAKEAQTATAGAAEMVARAVSGQPVQGAISEVQGASDVEGMANAQSASTNNMTTENKNIETDMTGGEQKDGE